MGNHSRRFKRQIFWKDFCWGISVLIANFHKPFVVFWKECVRIYHLSRGTVTYRLIRQQERVLEGGIYELEAYKIYLKIRDSGKPGDPISNDDFRLLGDYFRSLGLDS